MSIVDFNQKINRDNTSSVKWEMTETLFGSADILPMWVADMDFLPPAEVNEAISTRAEHGIYGYTFIPPSTAKAITGWVKKQHGWDIPPSWLLYSTGVVPAIGMAIQAYTEPGDRVLVQSPVYTPFFSMIENNDRVVENSPLVLENGQYKIDFADFERRLQSGVKLFLLCNPHNPGGRVWTKDELTKIGELCLKYNCLILSDEIHSDLIYKPNKHIPIASLDERFQDIVITCIAPSKTFNLAGLQASVIIIPNQKVRTLLEDQQKKQGFFTLSTIAIVGMEAAYRYGEAWLEQLLDHLTENRNFAINFIKEHLPKIEAINPEGTYLLWIDCRDLGLSDDEIKTLLIQKGKLALEPGPKYGQGGDGFVRLNFACPRETLTDGLNRLKTALT